MSNEGTQQKHKMMHYAKFSLEQFIQINVRAGEKQMKAHESLECTTQEEHASCLDHLNARPKGGFQDGHAMMGNRPMSLTGGQ